MAYWQWGLIIFGIYSVIAGIIFALDGWFEFSKDEDDLIGYCAAWPFMALLLPLIIPAVIHDALRHFKKQKKEKEKAKAKARKEEEKIRIAELKEQDLLIKEIEKELKESLKLMK